MSVPVDAFLELLLSQDGDRYIFGHEVSHSDSDPDAFDCSELIEWACARLGVTPRMPDGSWYQARHVRKHGLLIFPPDQAIRTRGALLFRFSSSPFTGGRPASAHVAVSLGNGETIEARSTRHGVGRFSAHGRGWTHAGLVPGLDYERKPMAQPLKDYEKKAIARLEREGIFTKFTTDEPGEIDRPVRVRTFAVILDRLLDVIPRLAGGGKVTRDQIVRTIVDALQD